MPRTGPNISHSRIQRFKTDTQKQEAGGEGVVTSKVAFERISESMCSGLATKDFL